MKNFKMLIVLVNISTTVAFAITGSTAPETLDRVNPKLLNTLPAVKILDLKGTDSSGIAIENFLIVTLPSSESGILYLKDCKTKVTVSQKLSDSSLCFDPKKNFVGNSTFTYSSIDANDEIDLSPATVTIPIIDNNGKANEPTTKDLMHTKFINTVASVKVLSLEGKDVNGGPIDRFIINSLPAPESGTLYLKDCSTAVTVGQELNIEEARTLCFIPNNNFVGNAIFTYSSVDSNGVSDSSPATVTIPFTDHTVHDENCTCNAYESSIPSFSSFGSLWMFMLTALIGGTLVRKEL